jgi:hypothetical protein
MVGLILSELNKDVVFPLLLSHYMKKTRIYTTLAHSPTATKKTKINVFKIGLV